MIKYHISRKKRISFNVNGAPLDLLKETAILISLVYKTIKKQYPESAEKFKVDLLTLLLPADSPVWKED